MLNCDISLTSVSSYHVAKFEIKWPVGHAGSVMYKNTRCAPATSACAPAGRPSAPRRRSGIGRPSAPARARASRSTGFGARHARPLARPSVRGRLPFVVSACATVCGTVCCDRLCERSLSRPGQTHRLDKRRVPAVPAALCRAAADEAGGGEELAELRARRPISECSPCSLMYLGSPHNDIVITTQTFIIILNILVLVALIREGSSRAEENAPCTV